MRVETIDYQDKLAGVALYESLKATGFAVLDNHPISPDRIAEMYELWAAFFAGQEKFAYAPEPSYHDGYFAFGSENAKDSPLKDLKEFFHVYPQSRLPTELADKTNAIYADLQALGIEVLSWIQQHTPAEVKESFTMPLHEMLAGSSQSLLRVLHYPPVAEHALGAMRAAPHEDINLITLLLSGSNPGLQAKDAHGVWHDISHDKRMVTINTGDMLAMASNNYYPSTTHRVINPDPAQNVSRYSMPMFLHPRPDVLLRPDRTADDYRQERLREIGLTP
jgi:isopenicillin N synthase-like dioxygenase